MFEQQKMSFKGTRAIQSKPAFPRLVVYSNSEEGVSSQVPKCNLRALGVSVWVAEVSPHLHLGRCVRNDKMGSMPRESPNHGEYLEWLQAELYTHVDPRAEKRHLGDLTTGGPAEFTTPRLSVGMKRLAIQNLQAPVLWSLGHPSPEEFQPGQRGFLLVTRLYFRDVQETGNKWHLRLIT